MTAPANTASAEAAEAAEAAQRRVHSRRMAPAYRQLAGFLFAFALVVALMVGWAWAQHQEASHPELRLYGEMAFLGLFIWWGITVLSSLLARATRAIHPSLEVPAISTGQALVWAAITVVAVPMAIQLHTLSLVVIPYISFVIPIAVSTACSAGIWFARRRSKRVPRQPLCFSVVAGALALVPLAAFAQDNGPQELGLAARTTPVEGAEALASQLRPLLFFDEEEKFQPVKIERADADACKFDLGVGCDPVNWSSLEKARSALEKALPKLETEGLLRHLDVDKLEHIGYAGLKGKDFIKVTAPALELSDKRGGPTSAMYYHVFKRKEKLYVDYWWYFAQNPAPVAGNVLCGKALTRGWLGVACAEHPADWEGITLMLVPRKCDTAPPDNGCVTLKGSKSSTTYEVRQVHYAQHEKVVWYPWSELQKRWRDSSRYAGNHPLVFVARDSHASYAEPCRKKCNQLVHTEFRERRNGELTWTNNDKCPPASCLLPLAHPTTGAPWKWNAFAGRWGNQHCILLESYCDTQRAPKSPAWPLKGEEKEQEKEKQRTKERAAGIEPA